jgi:hypothetical protein
VLRAADPEKVSAAIEEAARRAGVKRGDIHRVVLETRTVMSLATDERSLPGVLRLLDERGAEPVAPSRTAALGAAGRGGVASQRVIGPEEARPAETQAPVEAAELEEPRAAQEGKAKDDEAAAEFKKLAEQAAREPSMRRTEAAQVRIILIIHAEAADAAREAKPAQTRPAEARQ